MTLPRIYLSPPHITGNEQKYVADAIASNWVAPVGPHLSKFEETFAQRVGVGHAVAVSSGTAAIHLAIRLLDVAPKDELLCSSLTFIASATPILYEGATPVFIDSEQQTWNMDPQLLAEELAESDQQRKLPKAIIVTDILGQSPDMNAILEVAGRYDIPVIEDAAQSLGSTYQGHSVGTQCWASTFSFNGNKIITTSGGGMFCSNDAAHVERARWLSTQARDPVSFYQHTELGYNYRMSNIVAAIGVAQLETLDERVAARRHNFDYYCQRLQDIPGLTMMPMADYGQSNCWLTTLQIDADRFGASCDELCAAAEQENIEIRRIWKPLHRQPLFSGCRFRGGEISEQVFERGVFLPSGSALTDDDLNRVCKCIEATSHKR